MRNMYGIPIKSYFSRLNYSGLIVGLTIYLKLIKRKNKRGKERLPKELEHQNWETYKSHFYTKGAISGRPYTDGLTTFTAREGTLFG